MQAISALWGDRDNPGGKILLVALAIVGLMILFPPKVIVKTNPILNASETTSAGYTFIFSDPAAEQKAAARTIFGDDVDKLIASHIEWGKLFLQLVVVAGGAYAAARFFAKQQAASALHG